MNIYELPAIAEFLQIILTNVIVVSIVLVDVFCMSIAETDEIMTLKLVEEIYGEK